MQSHGTSTKDQVFDPETGEFVIGQKGVSGAAGKCRQLQDVASRYSITPQRASQIVKAALDKLHKALAA